MQWSGLQAQAGSQLCREALCGRRSHCAALLPLSHPYCPSAAALSSSLLSVCTPPGSAQPPAPSALSPTSLPDALLAMMRPPPMRLLPAARRCLRGEGSCGAFAFPASIAPQAVQCASRAGGVGASTGAQPRQCPQAEQM